ncbi:helix-hairpin-helix domain-containing protein [Oceanobacillus kapialis]|uniref:helix-hairpin-helix domain-containing protein n=1 Tax=Oceanobacillus kapialis TaxID=481353 RepID=UPI00384C31BD
MTTNPKLPLSNDERVVLRKAKVKLRELHTFDSEQIAQLLGVSSNRAKTLKGLADFQRVPSVGNKLADRLVFQLNLFSLCEIKEMDGGKLFDELERTLGVWIDSCVEDQIRCVINFANNPESKKQWYDFTNVRKAYRNQVGFPKDRPTKAWYE